MNFSSLFILWSQMMMKKKSLLFVNKNSFFSSFSGQPWRWFIYDSREFFFFPPLSHLLSNDFIFFCSLHEGGKFITTIFCKLSLFMVSKGALFSHFSPLSFFFGNIIFLLFTFAPQTNRNKSIEIFICVLAFDKTTARIQMKIFIFVFRIFFLVVSMFKYNEHWEQLCNVHRWLPNDFHSKKLSFYEEMPYWESQNGLKSVKILIILKTTRNTTI